MPPPFVIPTSVPKENYYTALSSEGDKNNDVTVVISNTATTSLIPNAEMIYNTKRVTRAVKHDVSYSGATGHLLIEGAPVKNEKIVNKPISITLPNGRSIRSTYTCNLGIPWLPYSMTGAHIVPGLAHLSLMSTRNFWGAGCTVVFEEYKCRVYFEGRLVLSGGRYETTELWKLPINTISNKNHQNQQSHLLSNLDLQTTPNQQQTAMHSAHSLYTFPYKQNKLNYMHQSFLNAPLQLLIDADLNNQLMGIPFLNDPESIRKYLVSSPETPEGHMKLPQAGIRSTRKITKRRMSKKFGLEISDSKTGHEENTTIIPAPLIIPNDETQANNIFCCAGLSYKQTGTLYTDATGALPTMSLNGMQYFFVVYDYNTNFIFALPIAKFKDATLVEAFYMVFTELTEKGHKPTFNVTNNQAMNPPKNIS